MKYINADKAPVAVGPYSHATLKKGLLIISGQLPIEDGVQSDDPRTATFHCLNNILAIVEEAGGTKEDIMRCGVFVTDIEDFGIINDAYEEFFEDHKPARALVEVSRLPKDAIVEIEATAFID